MPKPEPVAVVVVCSLCDEPWGAHGDKPSTEDCIRLLKAKLAAHQTTVIYRDRWNVVPYYPQPVPYWQSPNTTITCDSNTTTIGGSFINGVSIEYRRPDDGPTPIAA